MAIDQLLSNHDVLRAAWERTNSWYRGADWAPQPDWAAWQLNSEGWLKMLGTELGSENYKVSKMPIVPYPKKGGRLRHYCQPNVKDQVAFLVFGVLLAPVFESIMSKSSFGNRWYRGISRSADSKESKWQLRNWSLADRQLYQPYRRAHGLFRKVANWTVDRMLKGANDNAKSDERDRPEDYTDIISDSVQPDYWPEKPSDRVFWMRLDLRYAFPSVKLDLLLASFNRMSRSISSSQIHQEFIRASLSRFPSAIVEELLKGQTLRDLVEYLGRLLKTIRYETIVSSNIDECLFPDDPLNPPYLPKGNGENHLGLPTGLALSPFLLNIYLDPIDVEMNKFRKKHHQSTPFSFIRFCDDLILLSTSQDLLMEGMELLLNRTGEGPSPTDFNLRINRKKIQPPSANTILDNYFKNSNQPLSQWFSDRKNVYYDSLNQSAVTTKTRDPFVTLLVERLSELGAESELDSLPKNAERKLAQLQDIILLNSKDDSVPRETQLVFSASQLARAWLPEESFHKDSRLLSQIRVNIGEAIRDAGDKPKLWRSAIQAALRRPISGEDKTGKDLMAEEDSAAYTWIGELLTIYSINSKRPANDDKTFNYEDAWPYFASYHRSAFWNAFASVSREITSALKNFSDSKQFPSSQSWLFRAFDDNTLAKSEKSLHMLLKIAVRALYGGDPAILIREVEASTLAVAVLSIIPRSYIIKHFDANDSRGLPFLKAVARLLKFKTELHSIATIISRPKEAILRRANFRRLLWMTYPDKNEIKAATAFCETIESRSLMIKIVTTFNWQYLVDRSDLISASRLEIEGHNERLKNALKRGSWAVRKELDRYSRARSILLQLQ